MTYNKITVFCGSSGLCDKMFLDAAKELGVKLARSKRGIIYGGGNIGLMKELADGCLSASGRIVGVIPRFMNDMGMGHQKLTKLVVVEDMQSREEIMMLQSNCIIALPGGCGTFSELMQVITWKSLGIINVPIIIGNLKNYFNPLIKQLNHSVTEGFMDIKTLQNWATAYTVEEILQILNEFDEKAKKENRVETIKM